MDIHDDDGIMVDVNASEDDFPDSDIDDVPNQDEENEDHQKGDERMMITKLLEEMEEILNCKR